MTPENDLGDLQDRLDGARHVLDSIDALDDSDAIRHELRETRQILLGCKSIVMQLRESDSEGTNR